MIGLRALVFTIMAAILWMGSPRGYAQTSPTTTAATSQAVVSDPDRAALRALIPLYEEAAGKGKPELLQPYLAPDFTGIMVTGDSVSGYESLPAYWARMREYLGDSGAYRVKVTLDGPAAITGDVAVAHGTTDEVATRSGKEYSFQGQWTAVLRKIDGQWKLQRVHASMYPISNPFVAELVRGTAMLWSAVAGIGGLVIGWLLHVVITQRRKVVRA